MIPPETGGVLSLGESEGNWILIRYDRTDGWVDTRFVAKENSSPEHIWTKEIVAALERNKAYPDAAKSRGERGVAQVFFSLDRQGNLVSSRILRSSGSELLDQEALDVIRRSEPFPPPPSELQGQAINLTVPIFFSLK